MLFRQCAVNLYRLLVGICVLVFVVGCQGTEPPSTATVPAASPILADSTFMVQRGKVVRLQQFAGRVSPVEGVTLYFKSSGYVRQVYVEPGDRIKQGDLLAELEMDDLLNQIAQAEVALNSAQLRLSDAEDALAREIVASRLNLEVAKTRSMLAEDTNAYQIEQNETLLILAREQLARTLALQATYDATIASAGVQVAQAQDMVQRAEIAYKEALDRPWEPQEVRDAAAREVQQAEWVLEAAQAQYDQAVADEAVYQHDIKIQEIAVKQAEAELAQLQKGVDPLLALEIKRAQQELDWLEEDLEKGVDSVLINDVDQAELALERLQQSVSDGRILATIDGEIVSLSLYAGRLIEAFRGGIVVADPSTLEVSADLTDKQVQALYEGQKATVTLDTHPGRTWSSTIRCLPYPYGTCGSADGSTGSSSSVRISLEDDGQGYDDLTIGTLARVTIVLQEKDDVLWLPPQAIRSFQDRQFVMVQEGEQQRRVDIKIGVRGDDRIEIVEGLEEGQVIVAPQE